MKTNRHFRFAVTLVFALLPSVRAGSAAEPFSVKKVQLYNAIEVFANRAPNSKLTAEFINAINAKAATLWKPDAKAQGRDGIIAVAICPGAKAKMWIDIDGAFQPDLSDSLFESLGDVPVPSVRYGPVASAIHFSLWGGSGRKPKDEHSLPQKWRKAAQAQDRKLLIPDDILPLAWGEARAQNGWGPSELKPIPGYVVQKLDPLGGSILRPKEWHFRRWYEKGTFAFQIAKEPLASRKEFETGLTINVVVGVKEKSNVSPSAYAEHLISQKLRVAELLLREKPRHVGKFLRNGILIRETKTVLGKKQPFRIGYTLFAHDEADFLVVMVFGTPESEWKKNEKIYKTMMAEVILADAKKRRSKPQPKHAADSK